MVKTKAHLSCILILDMFIDNENSEFETSAEVDQHVNGESSENIIFCFLLQSTLTLTHSCT